MDRDRVLAKLDEMDGYLGELRSILPATSRPTKPSRSDAPASARNIVVHEYDHVLDELILETITTRLGDFGDFKRDVLQALAQS